MKLETMGKNVLVVVIGLAVFGYLMSSLATNPTAAKIRAGFN